MALYEELPFHPGELQIQKAMRVPAVPNPTISARSAQLANHVEIAPLISLGAVDEQGRPWTTLAGGYPGLGKAIGTDWIGIRAPVSGKHDPVVEVLASSANVQNRMISGLTIDLQTRKRVKLYGRLVASMLQTDNGKGEEDLTDSDEVNAELQLVLAINQSLGNCPKYLNSRAIKSAKSCPRLTSTSVQLNEAGIQLVGKADLFFITSRNAEHDMDTNHRGGNSGFLQLISNDVSGAVLCWPEYSGNRLYQTLGNLTVTAKAGLCIPNFDTGDVLYLTGVTEVLVGQDAAAVLPRAKLAVKLRATEVRFVTQALPFRGVTGQKSPYNPKIIYVMSNKHIDSTEFDESNATLLRQEPITPSISRFTFALSEKTEYKIGQYVTLDFSEHLDQGYSHMRDDDPRSLNDDFIRTFTVSSRSSSSSSDSRAVDNQFEITIRKVGSATNFLFKYGLPNVLTRLELGFRGFDGEFRIEHTGNQPIAFIAAGVGVTPILPSLPDLDPAKLTFLWSVRSSDIPLVSDVLKKHPGFGSSLKLFVSDAQNGLKLSTLPGVTVEKRRLQKEDLQSLPDKTKIYVCTATPMRKQLMEWLPGRNFIFEDFNF